MNILFYRLFSVFLFLISHSLYSEKIGIRSFDLGGGGLKTTLLIYDTDSQKFAWPEAPVQLGRCPAAEEVHTWIRACLQEKLHKDLDKEVQAGYRFSFSLAGLDKLRSRPFPTADISILFNLPQESVFCLGDGEAHLMGSLYALKKELPRGFIWNFGVGTGVAVACSDGDAILSVYECVKSFGFRPWNLQDPITGRSIGERCNARAFDEIRIENKGDEEKSFDDFAARWLPFLNILSSQIAQRKPSAFIFTGGHMEAYQEKLIQALQKRKLSVPVFKGPAYAGLLGSAFYAVREKGSKVEQRKDINQRDRLGNTALFIAVENGCINEVMALLEKGAFVDQPDFAGLCPLHIAVQKGDFPIASLLINSGADVHKKDYWGRIPLSLASERKDIWEELLLQRAKTEKE